MHFTDARGRAWTIIDYRVVDGRKRRVPLNSREADGRAFVPDGWDGPVMLYCYGHVVYYSTDPKLLENELHFAKPVHASAAERMNGHP